MLTDNGLEYDTKTTDVETIPCGKSVTTCYLLSGKVVRQDVEIQVDKGVLLGAEQGEL